MSRKEFTAKITSKNQLTLPAGVSAFLHAGPGDSIRFEIDGDTVTVSPLSVRERLAPLIGRKRRGKGKSAVQIDKELTDLRGPRGE
ncbi:MAG TPA: hypothetical protein VJP85_00750 [Candidatus Baltobacteraceae bacterium]|nr:hypothetical protein [Candidatus Baltobacteraceae bacterium]